MASPAFRMPPCVTVLDGVAEKWALEPVLVARLSNNGRLLEPKDKDKDMKTGISDAAHNSEVLRPLLECVAENASWSLFSLPEVEKQLLACMQTRLIMSSACPTSP